MAPSCAALDDPVFQVVKPKNEASLDTPWSREAAGAAKHGFTEAKGALFKASTAPAPGLVPVNRLFRGLPQDFIASAQPGEWKSAKTIFSFDDQGTRFYASPVAADCLIPVYRYRKGAHHRLVATKPAASALGAAGWKSEGISFYAAPAGGSGTGQDLPPVTPTPKPTPTPTVKPTPTTKPTPAPTPTPTVKPTPTPTPTPTAKPTPTVQPAPPAKPAPPADPPTTPPADGETFTFAMMPDTQQEVLRASDKRFLNRTEWLAAQEDELNLKFVGHTGDVVNWDTPDHAQYQVAQNAMKPLENAGIPYSLSIGNHDTEASGVGGSARDPKQTRVLQRDTSTFNSYFKASRYTDVGGAFEPGKVDNIYSTFEAGGLKWMVVTLELWPRKSAVNWAKNVVSSHPDYNVIIQTHSYLDGGSGISQGAEYGETSPQYLYDNLVSQYANVRFVFSGHVGVASNREDTGVKGNKIYSFEQTFHSQSTNPVRLIQINPKTNTVHSWIYAPYNKQTWNEYETTQKGMTFVR